MTDYNREDPGCLTLSEDMMDTRDFKAEELIQLDRTVQLPKSFSLGKRVYTTNYQNWWGSCTANATSHGAQILNVKDSWRIPTSENIFTPDWKDLRKKMWHDIENINDSGDYVEKAMNTAINMKIKNIEWWESNIDWYSYQERTRDENSIETIKRYIYNWNPVNRCLRWNQTTWTELTKGQLKTFIPADKRTWGHAVICVWWDEWWLRFLNSWRTNDGKWYKSRFYVTNDDMIKTSWMWNRRYRPLFRKEQAKVDPEYIKRKNSNLAVLKVLKKNYPEESIEVKLAIEKFSQQIRKSYPEINEELPLK